MSTPRTLEIGDCTYSKTFNKVSRGDGGAYLDVGFKAPKGEEFVSMLIGVVPAKTVEYDLQKMLKRHTGLFHVTEVEDLLVEHTTKLFPDEATARLAAQTTLQSIIAKAQE